MSVKGEIKEAAGFVTEEINEHGTSTESKQKAEDDLPMKSGQGL